MPHRVPPEPDAEHLLRAYRWMLTARRIDDVGVAYANRQLGTHAVVWIGFGDGGAQKGEVHEATNFAAIHRLAVVFGVANNLYTQSRCGSNRRSRAWRREPPATACRAYRSMAWTC